MRGCPDSWVQESEGYSICQSGGGPTDVVTKEFHTAAARARLSGVCAARMARPDLLRSIAYLARYSTKWTQDRDKKLHRLMAYINNSLGSRIRAWNQPNASNDPLMLRGLLGR